jgi:hypothetical protein
LYPRRSRDETRRKVRSPMANPDPRGERNNRMPGKRRPAEVSGLGRSRDPRDMAKAGLPESQSPDDEIDASVGTTPDTDAMLCDGMGGWPSQPSGHGALPSEGNQGDEWDAYVTLDTCDRDERGINPRVARPRGDGVLVVVVGATTHQGGRESRPQGEGRRRRDRLRHAPRPSARQAAPGWSRGLGAGALLFRVDASLLTDDHRLVQTPTFPSHVPVLRLPSSL